MNKTLIAAFSVVVIPLGLVVSASATDPTPSHTASYTVQPLRAISVEPRLGGGSADIDFGTIAKTGVKTNIDLRVRFTAEDADDSGSSAAFVSVKINVGLGGAALNVKADTVNGATTNTLPPNGWDVTTSGVQIIPAARGGENGFTDATSDLTYTLTTTNATGTGAAVQRTVTFTLQ